MRYLLDTNVVIGLLSDGRSKLARRARREDPAGIAISAIVVNELFYGAYKGRHTTQNLALIESLLFGVVEFDKEDARQAAEIRALLASQGIPIGSYDVLTAGQARSRDVTLVTHNTKEFGRVPGLRCDDWQV